MSLIDHEARMFFLNWLKAPRQVASVIPSSRALSARMAAEVPKGPPGLVIELGAGTGVVTRALLASGVAATDLVVVERESRMAAHLQRKFPGVQVLCEDARRLHQRLHADGQHPRIRAVVSSLPLLAMSPEVRRDLILGISDLLDPDTHLIQFTYGLGSPISRRLQHRSALTGRRVGQVWNNLPPAAVWRYARADRQRQPAPLAA